MEAIKKSVLEQFSSSLKVGDILLSLLVSAALAILIIYLYRKTFAGVVYNRGTALTILLITLATSMIIRTINSNLSLSLGMVGALSIVRFRTAIKDPVDTAYLFWAVTAGIMSGAGLYFHAIIGSLGIAVLYYLAYYFTVKSKKDYILLVTYEKSIEEEITVKLSEIQKKQLKSKNINAKYIEETYQVALTDEISAMVDELKENPKVKNINLIAYNNDFGL